jgi:hypothetical protein
MRLMRHKAHTGCMHAGHGHVDFIAVAVTCLQQLNLKLTRARLLVCCAVSYGVIWVPMPALHHLDMVGCCCSYCCPRARLAAVLSFRLPPLPCPRTRRRLRTLT